MRKLKGSGNYLRNQTWKNFAKAALCLIVFGIVLFPVTLRILLTLQVDLFDEAAFLISPVPLAGFYIYMRRYRIYMGGLEGEKRVTKMLDSTLSDEYYLINGIHFRYGGDIDHIVLGPNGVFVIETKNWSGRTSCNGDTWQRQGKRNMGNPSEQAKKNAARIKRDVESSGKISFNVWAQAIVVFTNNHADLHINNPTVPILNLHQLPNYITTYKNCNHVYTTQQLETIGEEIRKQID